LRLSFPWEKNAKPPNKSIAKKKFNVIGTMVGVEREEKGLILKWLGLQCQLMATGEKKNC